MNLNRCESKQVTLVDVVTDDAGRKALIDWVYSMGGITTRSGPQIKDFRAVPDTCHVVGWVPALLTEKEVRQHLEAL